MSARITVPEWFFNVKLDEYVGVSLPKIDTRFADVRRDFALLAAGIQNMLPSKDTYQYTKELFFRRDGFKIEFNEDIQG